MALQLQVYDHTLAVLFTHGIFAVSPANRSSIQLLLVTCLGYRLLFYLSICECCQVITQHCTFLVPGIYCVRSPTEQRESVSLSQTRVSLLTLQNAIGKSLTFHIHQHFNQSANLCRILSILYTWLNRSKEMNIIQLGAFMEALHLDQLKQNV